MEVKPRDSLSAALEQRVTGSCNSDFREIIQSSLPPPNGATRWCPSIGRAFATRGNATWRVVLFPWYACSAGSRA